MNKLVYISFLALLLSACQNKVVSEKIKTGVECFNKLEMVNGKVVSKYCNDNKEKRTYFGENYSVIMPGEVFAFLNQDPISFRPNTNNDGEPTEYLIEIYTRTWPCAPDWIGENPNYISLETNGDKTYWERVLFKENIHDLSEPPICTPPPFPNLSDEEIARFAEKRAAYVLCSEKNGKTVVICLQQANDNPDQAKQIFETFRWTE